LEVVPVLKPLEILGHTLTMLGLLGARSGKDAAKTFVPGSACFDLFPQHGLWHRIFGS